eukprot:256075_1
MFFNAMICTVIINKECIKVLSGVVINRWDIIGPMIMKRCIHNLIQHKYVIAIFTILMSVWKLSRTSEYIMIGHMIDNEKLLQHYLADYYNSFELTSSETDILYEEFVKNSLTKEEKEIAITRLKSIAELKLHEKFFWEFLHLQK